MTFLWSHLGLNQGPPDYESGATNQLSYRTSSIERNFRFRFVSGQSPEIGCKGTTKIANMQGKCKKVYF